MGKVVESNIKREKTYLVNMHGVRFHITGDPTSKEAQRRIKLAMIDIANLKATHIKGMYDAEDEPGRIVFKDSGKEMRGKSGVTDWNKKDGAVLTDAFNDPLVKGMRYRSTDPTEGITKKLDAGEDPWKDPLERGGRRYREFL